MAATGKTGRTWTRASHRWLGVALLLPLTIVCLTGIILNHSVDLGLSGRHISAGWILKRYGMQLSGAPTVFGLNGESRAASWDGHIFFQKNTIEDASDIVGAIPLRNGTAVVTSDSVHYFGLDGELIESMGSLILPPGPIIRAGRSKDLELVLEAPSGVFTGDTNLLDFTKIGDSSHILWSTVADPSPTDLHGWKTAYAGQGVPLDRVILDLHSGRFFGSIGKWLYDLTVIGVLILSFTGFTLFLRTRRRARRQ